MLTNCVTAGRCTSICYRFSLTQFVTVTSAAHPAACAIVALVRTPRNGQTVNVIAHSCYPVLRVQDLQSLDASRCLQSASVCTATNAAASLIVAEREYSLTIVPLHAVHQYFDKLVAGVMRDDGLEVHPDSHDMHVSRLKTAAFLHPVQVLIQDAAVFASTFADPAALCGAELRGE